MSEAEVREEICRIGASLHARGYAHSTAGNISARLADGFLITPTDACLGFLEPSRLARLNSAGEQISGDRASKTIQLHRAIYAADPDMGAVVHTHSTNLVALSLLSDTNPNEILPPITPYSVMKVGPIPMIPYRRPGAPEVSKLVTPMVLNHRGVLLQALGPVIWGKCVSTAAFCLEELEETAKLWLMTRSLRPTVLSDADVADLNSTFGKR
jgi:ribulose-5-phosphate 4-epimerase/fuculose-1-phosphate aldolase